MTFIPKHLGASPGSFPGRKFHINFANYPNSVSKDEENRISEIIDESGSNIKAVQSVILDKPVLELNAMNGKPAAFFNGTTHFLDLTNYIPSPAGNFTLFVVLKTASTITSPSPEGSLQVLFGSQSLNSPNEGSIITLAEVTWGLSGETVMFIFQSSEDIPINASYGYVRSVISPDVKVIKFQLTGIYFTIHINGILQQIFHFNTTPSKTFGSGRSFININRIGKNRDEYGSYFSGHIGEIIYYDNSMLTQHAELQTNLLLDFWG